jgi:predicted nucleic acid-binding Zn ribbon protein
MSKYVIMPISYSDRGKMGMMASKCKIDAYYNNLKLQYDLHPKFCKHCGKKIPYSIKQNIFCNHKCSALYNNTHKIPKHKCKYCGKPIKYNQKWCNKKCQTIYYTLQRIHNGTVGRTGIRHYLILTRGYKCESCGITNWKNSPISLECHHIDGNHNNNIDNNLQLLCPNCHAITNNYKSKNKTNNKKRVRSNDGKCARPVTAR